MGSKHVPDWMICLAIHTAHPTTDQPVRVLTIDRLEEWTGQPAKDCIRAMERAARRRLIGFDAPAQDAWLTDRGRRLIEKGDFFTAAMRDFPAAMGVKAVDLGEEGA